MSVMDASQLTDAQFAFNKIALRVAFEMIIIRGVASISKSEHRNRALNYLQLSCNLLSSLPVLSESNKLLKQCLLFVPSSIDFATNCGFDGTLKQILQNIDVVIDAPLACYFDIFKQFFCWLFNQTNYSSGVAHKYSVHALIQHAILLIKATSYNDASFISEISNLLHGVYCDCIYDSDLLNSFDKIKTISDFSTALTLRLERVEQAHAIYECNTTKNVLNNNDSYAILKQIIFNTINEFNKPIYISDTNEIIQAIHGAVQTKYRLTKLDPIQVTDMFDMSLHDGISMIDFIFAKIHGLEQYYINRDFMFIKTKLLLIFIHDKLNDETCCYNKLLADSAIIFVLSKFL